MSGKLGRKGSDHVQEDDTVGSTKDDFLDVVPVTSQRLTRHMNSVSERDIRRISRGSSLWGYEPPVTARVFAIRVVRPECQAAQRDGLPFLARVRGEGVIAVLDLDLEGVAADHCHDLPVELLVHRRHYMKSATSRAMSIA